MKSYFEIPFKKIKCKIKRYANQSQGIIERKISRDAASIKNSLASKQFDKFKEISFSILAINFQ